MPIFKYRGTDVNGKKIEGKQEATDKFALYRNLKKDGVNVTGAEEVSSKDWKSIEINIPFLSKVSAHDKIIFARNLGAMIEAGLPITRALSVMERQSKGLFKKILANLNADISKGITLSEAMKKYPNVFSVLFISMVKAGEESGQIVSALKNVSTQLEKSYQLTKKVRGAMMYPAVIFSLMIVIGILMMVYMVPTLTATFKGLNIKLPLSTRIIIYTSDLLKNYFLYFIFAIVGFVGGIIYFLRTKKGSRFLDYISIHFPLIGEMVKQVNSARTARTLSSLISSGVDIVVAISVTKDVVQNSYYKEILVEAEKTIQKGDQISNLFITNSKLYPLFVGEMVSVGEETGKIGDMLLGVAQFYEDEVDQKTKNLSSIIEPLLMIIIGVAVGAFAISMLAPTYSLVDAI